jgi:hypothetical protein
MHVAGGLSTRDLEETVFILQDLTLGGLIECIQNSKFTLLSDLNVGHQNLLFFMTLRTSTAGTSISWSFGPGLSVTKACEAHYQGNSTDVLSSVYHWNNLGGGPSH